MITFSKTVNCNNYLNFFVLIFFFNVIHFIFREGVFNLAGYLPDYCLKPELGPKMYIAYGSALYSNKGSTNLHIDMSDAVNYLVYVGFPTDGNAEENAKEVFKVFKNNLWVRHTSCRKNIMHEKWGRVNIFDIRMLVKSCAIGIVKLFSNSGGHLGSTS